MMIRPQYMVSTRIKKFDRNISVYQCDAPPDDINMYSVTSVDILEDNPPTPHKKSSFCTIVLLIP